MALSDVKVTSPSISKSSVRFIWTDLVAGVVTKTSTAAVKFIALVFPAELERIWFLAKVGPEVVNVPSPTSHRLLAKSWIA